LIRRSTKEEKSTVGAMQAIISGVMTIFFYAIVIAAVWKVFQATSELTEIKKLLTDIRHNTSNPVLSAQAVAAPAPAVSASVPQPVAHTPIAPTPVAVAPPPVNPMPAGPISLEAAEALLREVAAESAALEKSQATR
jgi:hypothetical protein